MSKNLIRPQCPHLCLMKHMYVRMIATCVCLVHCHSYEEKETIGTKECRKKTLKKICI